MDDGAFSRTELLLGREGLERLARARVAVFGLGGVGGYVVEALARSGVGALELVDGDRLCASNLNRQILATRRTLGQYKTDAARDRVKDINPNAEVVLHRLFYLPETAGRFDLRRYDYVVDAVDMVTAKLELAERCWRLGVPIVSSMGAGNKLDPSAFRVSDVYETSVCPLARVMRRELKRRGVPRLRVVYSREPPRTPPPEEGRRPAPGSAAFVPAAAGLILAGEAVRDLAGIEPGGGNSPSAGGIE